MNKIKISTLFEIDYILKNLTFHIEDEKIKSYVVNILLWNIKRAAFYKTLYYSTNITTIIITSIIPVLSLINKKMIILIAILSSTASILTGISVFLHSKESWYRYRKSTELIKQETIFYLNNYDKNNSKELNSIFLENITKICNDEFSNWENTKLKNNKKEDKS